MTVGKFETSLSLTFLIKWGETMPVSQSFFGVLCVFSTEFYCEGDAESIQALHIIWQNRAKELQRIMNCNFGESKCHRDRTAHQNSSWHLPVPSTWPPCSWALAPYLRLRPQLQSDFLGRKNRNWTGTQHRASVTQAPILSLSPHVDRRASLRRPHLSHVFSHETPEQQIPPRCGGGPSPLPPPAEPAPQS